jgi:XTP/dITP diphosphohydrolase
VKLPFATQNEGKINEARRVLSQYGIEVVPIALDISEPDAGSIEHVTREKLRQVREMKVDRAMVDDAGIFFAAYHQFPGVLTKRVFQGIGYRGVMKLLAGETREAWFEGGIALLWDGEEVFFSARTRGRLLESLPAGVTPEPGFPFDALFVPEGEHRTLAEMPPAERERFSYRVEALKELAEWLRRREGSRDS